MSPSISIGALKHIDLIKSHLNRNFRSLENKGLKLEIKELPMGKYTFLSCDVGNCSQNAGNQGYQIFKNYVANVVSDVILNKWENYIIYDIIRENYYYFNEDEKNKIFQYARQRVNEKDINAGFNSHLLYKRRNQVYQQLKDYLSQNNELVIEGFIQFRLKDYISFLREVIDSAVDEFLMEREYEEFIQILRYFVEIQEPKVDLAHVLVKPDGAYKLYNENKERINNDYLEDFIFTINKEINYEDLLVSALISISPRKIVFHGDEKYTPKNTLKTIKDVFVGRVEVCKGCHWCRSRTK
ncbi:putative sporulation protein YtxC [Desulfohalotomaculum tongense]|uniref:putative sporulation protein YtxC n=1 Tax=Desulforadius tongensis TaxID=1216062 RepID=UPI00195AD15F|nr:putative sporulation protein YtxC [Desulforadius tongensis]MBM7854774.1 putative sporulation protein YtxC [Desulforadius tongensis]